MFILLYFRKYHIKIKSINKKEKLSIFKVKGCILLCIFRKIGF